MNNIVLLILDKRSTKRAFELQKDLQNKKVWSPDKSIGRAFQDFL